MAARSLIQQLECNITVHLHSDFWPPAGCKSIFLSPIRCLGLKGQFSLSAVASSWRTQLRGSTRMSSAATSWITQTWGQSELHLQQMKSLVPSLFFCKGDFCFLLLQYACRRSLGIWYSESNSLCVFACTRLSLSQVWQWRLLSSLVSLAFLLCFPEVKHGSLALAEGYSVCVCVCVSVGRFTSMLGPSFPCNQCCMNEEVILWPEIIILMALLRMRSFCNFENRRIKGIIFTTKWIKVPQTSSCKIQKATGVAPYFWKKKKKLTRELSFNWFVFWISGDHWELRGTSLSGAGCIKALFNQSPERTTRLRNDSLTKGSRVFSVEEAGACRLKRATHERDVITVHINPQQIRPTNSWATAGGRRPSQQSCSTRQLSWQGAITRA